MPTNPASFDARERRYQRLRDNHPMVERLDLMRVAVTKLQAVADATREQNDSALYAALAALDDAAVADSVLPAE